MTPHGFLAELDRFSKQNDPDGMLAFAEQHLPEVMPELTASEMRRINALGEWAAMTVSLREFSTQTSAPNMAD